jgi:hypothetical protein
MITISLTVAKDRFTHIASALFNGQTYDTKSSTKSPIHGLCRKLHAAGADPTTTVDIYRGETRAFNQSELRHWIDKQVRDDDVRGLITEKYRPLPVGTFA